MHILKPTSILVDLRVCIIDNDPRLAKCKLSVNLPGIHVILTEEHILQVTKILYSLSFEFLKEETKPILKRTVSVTSFKSYQGTRSIPSPLPRRKVLFASEVTQHTALEIMVLLQEISVTYYIRNQSATTSPTSPTTNPNTRKVNTSQTEEQQTSIRSESRSVSGGGGGGVSILVSDSVYFDATNLTDLLLVNNTKIRKVLLLQIIMMNCSTARRTFEDVVNAR